jgi:radical SAM protein with 4Fe4S-binding SPASM domain
MPILLMPWIFKMVHYILSILSSLTFARFRNLLANEFSYFLSRITGNPLMHGLPWAVSIEPTTSCNLRCPECPSGLRQFTRPTGSMSIELYTKVIDQLSPHLLYLTLYFQGEPLLNSHFIEMVKYAKQRKIVISTSTNGHFLDDASARAVVESGLDRLIISMDGIDQATYEKYRSGGNLETVKLGIANILKWKKELNVHHPFVELQFLVLGTNEHQLPQIRKFARTAGVDSLLLKSAQLYNRKDNPFQTSIRRYSRYKKIEGGKLVIKNRLPDRCQRMWHSPVISWDGKILPCCFDKDAKHILGDLNNTGFAQIWDSDAYRSFRQRLFHHRREIDICRNCSEGL